MKQVPVPVFSQRWGECAWQEGWAGTCSSHAVFYSCHISFLMTTSVHQHHPRGGIGGNNTSAWLKLLTNTEQLQLNPGSPPAALLQG